MTLKPMRVLGWNIHWRRRRCEPVASFPDALTKVRSLRESCQWPPLSSAPAIQQRESRVVAARNRVHYSGLPEGLPIHVPRKPKLLWLCNVNPLYAVLALFLLALVAGFLLVVVKPKMVWGKTYSLPTAPAFLSEELALTKAQETITSSGIDAGAIKPVESSLPTVAPDGRRDMYLIRAALNSNAGIIHFRGFYETNRLWFASLLLESNSLSCIVQRLR